MHTKRDVALVGLKLVLSIVFPLVVLATFARGRAGRRGAAPGLDRLRGGGVLRVPARGERRADDPRQLPLERAGGGGRALRRFRAVRAGPGPDATGRAACGSRRARRRSCCTWPAASTTPCTSRAPARVSDGEVLGPAAAGGGGRHLGGALDGVSFCCSRRARHQRRPPDRDAPGGHGLRRGAGRAPRLQQRADRAGVETAVRSRAGRCPGTRLYLLATHVLAQTALLWAALRADARARRLAPLLVWFAVAAVPFANNLQFTVTAFVAAQSGLLLAVGLAQRRDGGGIGLAAVAAALAFLGSLIRFEAYLLALALAAARRGRDRVEGRGRRAWARTAAAIAASLVLALAARAFDAAYYARAPGWAAYREFNRRAGAVRGLRARQRIHAADRGRVPGGRDGRATTTGSCCTGSTPKVTCSAPRSCRPCSRRRSLPSLRRPSGCGPGCGASARTGRGVRSCSRSRWRCWLARRCV